MLNMSLYVPCNMINKIVIIFGLKFIKDPIFFWTWFSSTPIVPFSGAYYKPPEHYILCFLEGIRQKPKSLNYYDVIFEYFLGTLYLLNIFIL